MCHVQLLTPAQAEMLLITGVVYKHIEMFSLSHQVGFLSQDIRSTNIHSMLWYQQVVHATKLLLNMDIKGACHGYSILMAFCSVCDTLYD